MECGVAFFHDGVIACDGFFAGAFLVEARDIGTRNESLAACAGDNHHGDIVVVAVVIEHTDRRLPHVEGHSVGSDC